MRNVLKSFIFSLITIFTLVSVSFASPKESTPIVDEKLKVYDFADLFTDTEEDNLYKEIIDFIDNNDLDMVVVTINDNNKSSAKAYADDFYDYNSFGKNSTYDGLLFLIDMDNREIWLSTTGKAQIIYDDSRLDRILDSAYLEISSGEYFECARAVIRLADDYFKAGIPNSNKNAYIDEYGSYKVNSSNGKNFITVLMVSMIITVVFMSISLSCHKTIKKQTQAKEYLKNFNITDRLDNFLSTHTSKTYVSSSSSGSSSGGSSTHFSSSGRSHGGGGRRF